MPDDTFTRRRIRRAIDAQLVELRQQGWIVRTLHDFSDALIVQLTDGESATFELWLDPEKRYEPARALARERDAREAAEASK